MPFIDFTYLLVAAIAAFIVGLSKGGLSLLGSLAVPVLSLAIAPVTAAAVLLPVLIVSDLFGLWNYRREFDVRNIAILLPSGLIGVVLGWLTASLLGARTIGMVIGVIGLSFCFNGWRMRHVQPPRRQADLPRGIFWGTLLGYSSFVAHAGGPPYQVYVLPQQLPKAVYAGTTTVIFAGINLLKVIPYAALGQLGADNLRTSIWLLPIAVIGVIAGVRLVRIMPQRAFYTCVHVLLFIISIKLIIDGIK